MVNLVSGPHVKWTRYSVSNHRRRLNFFSILHLRLLGTESKDFVESLVLVWEGKLRWCETLEDPSPHHHAFESCPRALGAVGLQYSRFHHCPQLQLSFFLPWFSGDESSVLSARASSSALTSQSSSCLSNGRLCSSPSKMTEQMTCKSVNCPRWKSAKAENANVSDESFVPLPCQENEDTSKLHFKMKI